MYTLATHGRKWCPWFYNHAPCSKNGAQCSQMNPQLSPKSYKYRRNMILTPSGTVAVLGAHATVDKYFYYNSTKLSTGAVLESTFPAEHHQHCGSNRACRASQERIYVLSQFNESNETQGQASTWIWDDWDDGDSKGIHNCPLKGIGVRDIIFLFRRFPVRMAIFQ